MDRSQEYFYAGATTLAEQLDKTVIAILRDGRHIIGRLISFDHFGSLVLKEARERHIAGGKYCDVPMDSLYVVRGENLTLLGELDEELDGKNPLLEKADLEEVGALEAEEQAAAVAAGFGAKLPRSPSTADSEIVDKGAGGSGSGSSEVPSLTLKSASKVASVRRAPKQASTIAAYWNMGES